MNKRVIDIISPGEKESKPHFSISQKKKKSRTRSEGSGFQFALGKKGLISGGVLGLLSLVFIVAFFTLSKAEIEIWPEADSLIFKTDITIDKGAALVDFGNSIIPGEVIEKEKILTENFPATGKVGKEGKAEGTITVYNAYSTYSQILIATTRFVSTDGKLFRTPVRVTVPGGSYQGGKLAPGEIDIKIVADEAGEEYNIDPSTFSIPGFIGTDRYTKFYARSFDSMTGGFTTEGSQVTQEDLDKAENSLVKRVKEEVESSLIGGAEDKADYYFLDKTIQTEIVEKLSLAQAGEEASNFNYQAKAKSEALLFKKNDLIAFAKDYVNSQIPGDKKLAEDSLEIDFSIKNLSLKLGKVDLSLEISVTLYSDFELDQLKQNVLGKSLLETKIFLENQPEVNRSKIELWPFWVKSVPEDSNKVNLKLRVD